MRLFVNDNLVLNFRSAVSNQWYDCCGLQLWQFWRPHRRWGSMHWQRGWVHRDDTIAAHLDLMGTEMSRRIEILGNMSRKRKHNIVQFFLAISFSGKRFTKIKITLWCCRSHGSECHDYACLKMWCRVVSEEHITSTFRVENMITVYQTKQHLIPEENIIKSDYSLYSVRKMCS
jgi:hypothetical protein